ncbi:2-aminoethylphosphonate--pyruvate transaminase [Plakobranchus ocellatus]|uniref:2-aminoethylphosphonate--pyruvate transaminase n=1 Tax=Plakobranchus ocellatus TaxID=259542 RepID=A0AAV4AY85_9GAST|nr:2-aminoethylphosphonate--pyruvate transaminase [Plakobranchus ocellatus]
MISLSPAKKCLFTPCLSTLARPCHITRSSLLTTGYFLSSYHDFVSRFSQCHKSSPYHSISRARSQINSLPTRRYFSSSPCSLAEKKLFTPGPLGVTLNVKEAMLRDVGSRDSEFIECVKFIRHKLLDIAGVSDEDFCCIPVQGSGTFAVDAAFQTVLPREGARALVIENGSYGKRMVKICESAGIEVHTQSFREDQAVEPEVVEDALQGPVTYDLVAVVHSETSSGVINPVTEVGRIVKENNPDSLFLVDAISSFGAVSLDIEKSNIDIIISSANKCLQGVPGFAFVIARNSVIAQCKGNSRSLALDLYDQVVQLDKTSQFRFTPPTHSMLAFKRALEEFEAEGRTEGRSKRYAANRAVLCEGMTKLGFQELLDPSVAGYIITSYRYPKDPNFNFPDFYNRLNEKDFVIYPGKVLDADCFRIGSIGDLHPADMAALLVAVEEVCHDMGIKLPVQY